MTASRTCIRGTPWKPARSRRRMQTRRYPSPRGHGLRNYRTTATPSNAAMNPTRQCARKRPSDRHRPQPKAGLTDHLHRVPCAARLPAIQGGTSRPSSPYGGRKPRGSARRRHLRPLGAGTSRAKHTNASRSETLTARPAGASLSERTERTDRHRRYHRCPVHRHASGSGLRGTGGATPHPSRLTPSARFVGPQDPTLAERQEPEAALAGGDGGVGFAQPPSIATMLALRVVLDSEPTASTVSPTARQLASPATNRACEGSTV